MKSVNGTFLDPKDTYGRKASLEIQVQPELLKDEGYVKHLSENIKRQLGHYLVSTIPFERWTLIHITERWPEKHEIDSFMNTSSFNLPTIKLFVEYGTVRGENWIMPQMTSLDDMLLAPEPSDNSIQMKVARWIANLKR